MNKMQRRALKFSFSFPKNGQISTQWGRQDRWQAKAEHIQRGYNLAGSNRSGKQRQLPDQAGTSESESADYSAASRVLSETTAGTQVEAVGGDCHPLDIGAVDQSLVNSDQEGTGEIMSAESEAAAAKAAA